MADFTDLLPCNTPEDQLDLEKELTAKVYYEHAILNDALATAKKQFEEYYRGIFITQGISCSFEYK